MRVVFAAIPAYGHLYPLIPLAQAFRDAGHDVVVATGRPMLDRVPLPTVNAWASDMGLSEVETEAARRHPDAEGMDVGAAIFADVAAGVYAPALIAEFESRRPDLVIFEGTCLGAGIAASVHDIPAVAFGIGMGWEPFGPALVEMALRIQEPNWTARQLTPPRPETFAAGWLDPVPPGWSGPSGCPWPAHPIRTTAWSNGGVLPGFLDKVPSGRPRAYVTLGTVSFGAVAALRQAVVETAEVADVLVAIGPDGDPAALGELPAGVHLERFVAQHLVLPKVDVAVHHGGTGTVLGALAAGIPQVLMPQGADQFANARRLAELGAGRSLFGPPEPGAVRDAVSGVLGDSPERARTAELAAEIAAMPAPADVVADLVALAR